MKRLYILWLLLSWGNDGSTASTTTTDLSNHQEDEPPIMKDHSRKKKAYTAAALVCSDFSFHQTHNRDAKMGYRMAALSSLVYFQFHQQDLERLDFGLIGTQRSLRKLLRCRLSRTLEQYLRPFHSLPRDSSNADAEEKLHAAEVQSCIAEAAYRKLEADRHRVTLRYWLYDWHEPTALPGVSYHDTDLLISTIPSASTLILTFAGTASAADHATNLQTFERSNHSNFFHGGDINRHNQSSTIEGSLHRGFLNAYSRVERGLVLALKMSANATPIGGDYNSRMTRTLDQRFGNCTGGLPEKNEKKRKGCHSRDEKLITILSEVVSEALKAGKTVHLSGHSLGKLRVI
jgi:hypothetical protein